MKALQFWVVDPPPFHSCYREAAAISNELLKCLISSGARGAITVVVQCRQGINYLQNAQSNPASQLQRVPAATNVQFSFAQSGLSTSVSTIFLSFFVCLFSRINTIINFNNNKDPNKKIFYKGYRNISSQAMWLRTVSLGGWGRKTTSRRPDLVPKFILKRAKNCSLLLECLPNMSDY